MTDATPLPHAGSELYLTDGGLETTLLFLHGLDLPDFAAFPLLRSEEGRDELRRYFHPYLELAGRSGRPFLLDTPTWRANPDWGARAGLGPTELAAVNAEAVAFARELAAGSPSVATVINGAIGPRGDGYVVGEAMTADEARAYHRLQVDAFARAGADMVTAVTMTYVAEAIGITRAAVEAGIPVAIGFTTETDGRLPSGQALGDAIEELDRATEGAAVHIMVNCAHPSHFAASLDPEAPWIGRIQAIRANASRMSHAELDEAEDLDRGDEAELAADYGDLGRILPALRLVGGCCGTDHAHVAAIAAQLAPAAP